jgi:hypothetical protein
MKAIPYPGHTAAIKNRLIASKIPLLAGGYASSIKSVKNPLPVQGV